VAVENESDQQKLAAPSLLTHEGGHSTAPTYNIETFPMPTLSTLVTKSLEKKELLLDMRPFIKEVTEHLLGLIWLPTSADYANYAKALLIEFPNAEFKTDSFMECWVNVLKF